MAFAKLSLNQKPVDPMNVTYLKVEDLDTLCAKETFEPLSERFEVNTGEVFVIAFLEVLRRYWRFKLHYRKSISFNGEDVLISSDVFYTYALMLLCGSIRLWEPFWRREFQFVGFDRLPQRAPL